MCIVPQVTQPELEHEPRPSDSRQEREGLGEEGTFELEARQELAWGKARGTVLQTARTARAKALWPD